MANKLTLSESTIRSYTTSNSFERGYAYYERGDVLLVVQRGNLLLAEVAGSEYRPYEVQITLGGDGNGR
jgi:uncharacterized Zn finger protein